MNGTSVQVSWRELGRVIIEPHHLKKTITVALVVGTAFFALNQLGVVLAGHATASTWLMGALTYLTPFCVSNFGVVSASRRREVIR